MIITKPKETKDAFINEIKNNNDYIKAFSTSLEKSGDTKARQTFTSLSNADQSQENSLKGILQMVNFRVKRLGSIRCVDFNNIKPRL